ncbi:family 76 glycoside hydrolase [Trichoderma cornu-damae]|uniref:Mannan endo-1,6-alpha-mannosidase n=1 Tax=Trichoderma cornu-damae TaxID=654480 RepID=A0A9P8QYT8_9HYPO|nr:family 76 glycoside hydrolase [Trichoderma cornu-damae]
MKSALVAATAAVCLLGQGANAIELLINDDNSIRSAASTIAYGLMKFYTGNNTGDVPGNLPDPYYWWEAGAMFGTMIDYWHMTQDSTYNDVTIQAMLHQAGADGSFMPTNQTLTEGNDDQGFWAMAAMSAAENVFPNPPSDQPQWLAMAQAVFNQYVSRWDPNCGGGLRWQIFQWNKGYDYKNSVANGCFFNIAARLARYTGNQTYADWAAKVWAWEQSAGLIGGNFEIFDGVTILTNDTCSLTDSNQWSYNAGLYMHGAAAMYNFTNNATWKTTLDGIITESQSKFSSSGVVFEQFCEPRGFCSVDQSTFKGYLLRSIASTIKLAPYTVQSLIPLIGNSATAAASVCTGPASATFKGITGTGCGFAWLPLGTYDGKNGVGSQMNALDAVMYTLVQKSSDLATEAQGGTSKGDPGAGTGSIDPADELDGLTKPTAAGKVGAVILTILLLCCVLVGSAVLLL